MFQILVESSLVSPSHIMPTGTCILAEGVLQQPSVQGKNIIELKAEKVLHIGFIDQQDTYPLSKKRLPLDSLRDCAHFRPRTTTVISLTKRCETIFELFNSHYSYRNWIYVFANPFTMTLNVYVGGLGYENS